jgi:hypothetical protein
MIGNPQAEEFYGDKNDRMPAFAVGENAEQHRLDAKSLSLLVDWLRGQWYEPEKERQNDE